MGAGGRLCLRGRGARGTFVGKMTSSLAGEVIECV